MLVFFHKLLTAKFISFIYHLLNTCFATSKCQSFSSYEIYMQQRQIGPFSYAHMQTVEGPENKIKQMPAMTLE